jgi:hypothetical protein
VSLDWHNKNKITVRFNENVELGRYDCKKKDNDKKNP